MAALGTAFNAVKSVITAPINHTKKCVAAGVLVSAFAFSGGAAAIPLSQGLATAGTKAVAGAYNIAAAGIPKIGSAIYSSTPGAIESTTGFFKGVMANVKAGIASGPTGAA